MIDGSRGARSTITKMVKRGQLQARRDPRDPRILLVDREQVEAMLAEIREVYGEAATDEEES